jgi:hypothetical protein
MNKLIILTTALLLIAFDVLAVGLLVGYSQDDTVYLHEQSWEGKRMYVYEQAGACFQVLTKPNPDGFLDQRGKREVRCSYWEENGNVGR